MTEFNIPYFFYDSMTQPETQSSLGYVIERVEKLEIAIIKISERMDSRHKAYGEMFANLQKQIELLTIKTR